MIYLSDTTAPTFPKNTVVNLLSFTLKNVTNEQIYSINFANQDKVEIKIEVIAGIEPGIIHQLSIVGAPRIYLDAVIPGKHPISISSQFIPLSMQKFKESKSNLIKLNYRLTIPRKVQMLPQSIVNTRDIDITLSYTATSKDNSAIDESKREGTFFHTRIAVQD